MIKTGFTRLSPGLPRPVWQPRFWKHAIRDEPDFRRHLDYIHYNPVKHGYVTTPGEWRWSSFGKFVRAGLYAPDWGSEADAETVRNLDFE